MVNNSKNAMTEFFVSHQVRPTKPSTARAWLYVLMVLASLLSLSGCDRWSLDRQMETLCKKNGGVKVYETVTLPASEFSNVGQPLARFAKQATSIEDTLGPDYRYVIQKEVLVGAEANLENGRGRLERIHEVVYRRSDSRMLGEYLWYARGGGDGFTFGFQPSSEYCPKPGLSLINLIFLRGK